MQILDLTLPTPAENLACDEALLDCCEAGDSGEILRFWEPREPFVVVGYANAVATEVNVAECRTRRVPVLRRCSGGGTVVQGPGCLNYSVILKIAPDGPLRTVTSTNRLVMDRNRAALENLLAPRSLSIEGCTDLAVDGQKFSGNAQRRKKKFLLFHGTFLLHFDLALVDALLPMPSKRPAYRRDRAHAEFLTNLRLPAAAVKQALSAAWSAAEPPANVPRETIASLARDKYETSEWNSKF